MSKLCFESDFELLLDYIEKEIPEITIRACPGIEENHIYASGVDIYEFETTIEQGINEIRLEYKFNVKCATEEDLYDVKAVLSR